MNIVIILIKDRLSPRRCRCFFQSVSKINFVQFFLLRWNIWSTCWSSSWRWRPSGTFATGSAMKTYENLGCFIRNQKLNGFRKKRSSLFPTKLKIEWDFCLLALQLIRLIFEVFILNSSYPSLQVSKRIGIWSSPALIVHRVLSSNPGEVKFHFEEL